jgi:FkbM family methyltransferase
MHFGNLTLKQCKYGWMLFRGPYIGKCFDLYGQYSESEVAMMRNFLKPGYTVIDVGANIGDLTIPLSIAVGDSGLIYAVESNPDLFNVLCANLALNRILNTKPINAFIASSDAANTQGVWGNYAGETWEPNFLALDSMELEACNLIKIDVDGNELDVLHAAETTIEKHRPILYLENDVREKSPALLDFAIGTLGYDLYWHPAPIFEPDNFFGNPMNYWAPTNIVSLMLLGIPAEWHMAVSGLRGVNTKDDWWEPNAGPAIA